MIQYSSYLNLSEVARPLLVDVDLRGLLSDQSEKILDFLHRYTSVLTDDVFIDSPQSDLKIFYFADDDLWVHAEAVQHVCGVLGIQVPDFAVRQARLWSTLKACHEGEKIKDPDALDDLLEQCNDMHRFNLKILVTLAKSRDKLTEAEVCIVRYTDFFIPSCGPVTPHMIKTLDLHEDYMKFWKNIVSFLEMVSKITQFECNSLFMAYASRPE